MQLLFAMVHYESDCQRLVSAWCMKSNDVNNYSVGILQDCAVLLRGTSSHISLLLIDKLIEFRIGQLDGEFQSVKMKLLPHPMKVAGEKEEAIDLK